jgi:lipooligosaccharide transport system permease protein
MNAAHFALPAVSGRFVSVWRRNFLVWKKLAVPSVLGNIADPMIYMIAFGYGLGSLLPQVGGTSYIAFLAGGTICFSTMNSATCEALYSSFSRMHVQRTWDAILNAPMALDDIVFAEAAWAATKATWSGLAILLVVWALGLSNSLLSLWVIPVVMLTGLTFAALGLNISALAPSYDFFMYYFTLVVTPMGFLSGVFFPVSQLPSALQIVSAALPLSHAVDLARPLLFGEVPQNILLHTGVMLAYLIAGFYLALALMRRRILG